MSACSYCYCCYRLDSYDCDNKFLRKYENICICIVCENISYVRVEYMHNKYGDNCVPKEAVLIHDKNTLGNSKLHLQYVKFEDCVCTNNVDFDIEKKIRKMKEYVREKYCTHYDIHELLPINGMFLISNFIGRHNIKIACEHAKENNRIIEEYSHTLDSDEIIKEKLEENYKKYHKIFTKYTETYNNICSIIDDEIKNFEDIKNKLKTIHKCITNGTMPIKYYLASTDNQLKHIINKLKSHAIDIIDIFSDVLPLTKSEIAKTDLIEKVYSRFNDFPNIWIL